MCVNGKQQVLGRDYWETYAPVVSWASICLMLILSSILGPKTCQIDYTQAFPQAKLDDPVFIRVPQSWYIKDGNLYQHSDPHFNDTQHFLCLKRNIYGIKHATHNWFQYLRSGLLELGFTQSSTDCCLFLRKDCVIIVYVDDCLLFAPQQKTLDNVISDLSKRYILQNEGDVSAYRGVQVTKDPKAKTITLSQPGLIKELIQDLSLDSFSKGRDTPADGILYVDTNGLPCHKNGNYRSIIGKLNYLANNTHPDISMAVHQCARFSSAPNALHKLAVKRIVRYLSATSGKGITLCPTTNLTLEMYVDSDFTGMWHKEHSHLRHNILSRTGYVILFGGCPITWASKLQTEITLSTTESEYITLSSATRDLLPLRQILQDLDTYSFVSIPKQTSSNINNSMLTSSKIYEDSAACIVLATMTSNFKPCTKHISIK